MPVSGVSQSSSQPGSASARWAESCCLASSCSFSCLDRRQNLMRNQYTILEGSHDKLL